MNKVMLGFYHFDVECDVTGGRGENYGLMFQMKVS